MTGLRPGEDGAAKVTLVKRKNLELRWMFRLHPHPEVGQQRRVGVGQHGVAGTQGLHVHVRGQGGRGRVRRRLSRAVLLAAVGRRPGRGSQLQAAADGRRPPARALLRRVGGGAPAAVRAVDG